MKIIDNELLSRYIYEVGCSSSELARKTNISRSTLHNIVVGHNYPSHTVINLLASALDMTQNKFIEIFYPAIEFVEEKEHLI